MLHKLIITALGLLLLSSCSVAPCYDVYIQNSTEDEITIKYKSDIHVDGPVQDEVTLKARERLHLISTKEIKNNTKGKTTRTDCDIVADYITIYNSLGDESSIAWCTDAVQFAVVDIGQGEFTIGIKSDSFR